MLQLGLNPGLADGLGKAEAVNIVFSCRLTHEMLRPLLSLSCGCSEGAHTLPVVVNCLPCFVANSPLDSPKF